MLPLLCAPSGNEPQPPERLTAQSGTKLVRPIPDETETTPRPAQLQTDAVRVHPVLERRSTMAHAHHVTVVAILATCAATVVRADAPTRIKVAPWCSRTPDRLGFHLEFVTGMQRTVINLTCDLKASTCSGAKLDLAAADRGEALGPLALEAITGARVDRAGPGANRLHWGNHLFEVDHRSGFVTYDGMQTLCK